MAHLYVINGLYYAIEWRFSLIHIRGAVRFGRGYFLYIYPDNLNPSVARLMIMEIK